MSKSSLYRFAVSFHFVLALLAALLVTPRVGQANELAFCGLFERDDGSANWGELTSGNCPPNYAVFAVNTPGGSRSQSAEQVKVRAICCPLPSEDMLSNEHVRVFDTCPEGFVVTSATSDPLCADCRKSMRCTKLNQAKYQLGPLLPGAYWGHGSASWKQQDVVNRVNAPGSLRQALGRTGRYNWELQGCTGYPWGSLMVSKSTKRCQGFGFRQLLRLGENAEAAVIPVFQNCATIDDIYSKTPRCVSRDTSAKKQ